MTEPPAHLFSCSSTLRSFFHSIQNFLLALVAATNCHARSSYNKVIKDNVQLWEVAQLELAGLDVGLQLLHDWGALLPHQVHLEALRMSHPRRVSIAFSNPKIILELCRVSYRLAKGSSVVEHAGAAAHIAQHHHPHAGHAGSLHVDARD